MRKNILLLIGALIMTALPSRAELLQADLSIFGMD
jgi:hypothetical protein